MILASQVAQEQAGAWSLALFVYPLEEFALQAGTEMFDWFKRLREQRLIRPILYMRHDDILTSYLFFPPFVHSRACSTSKRSFDYRLACFFCCFCVSCNEEVVALSFIDCAMIVAPLVSTNTPLVLSIWYPSRDCSHSKLKWCSCASSVHSLGDPVLANGNRDLARDSAIHRQKGSHPAHLLPNGLPDTHEQGQ